MGDYTYTKGPGNAVEPVVEDNRYWWQTQTVFLVPIAALAVMAWGMTRAHSCGGSWLAAAGRTLFASGLSFAAAAFVAYYAFMVSIYSGIAIGNGRSESDIKRSEWLFRILSGLPWVAFAGISIGGVAFLTRCK